MKVLSFNDFLNVKKTFNDKDACPKMTNESNEEDFKEMNDVEDKKWDNQIEKKIDGFTKDKDKVKEFAKKYKLEGNEKLEFAESLLNLSDDKIEKAIKNRDRAELQDWNRRYHTNRTEPIDSLADAFQAIKKSSSSHEDVVADIIKYWKKITIYELLKSL